MTTDLEHHITERDKKWCQTYTGKRFYPLDPDPTSVDIRDIAHSLSNQCRYNGHTSSFYSVAEHSVLLAEYTNKVIGRPWPDALHALLHDASEAYLSDVPKPLKNCVPELLKLEENVDKVVMAVFGLPAKKPDWLRELDQRIVRDEKEALMFDGYKWPVYDNLEALGVKLWLWKPENAEFAFFNWYNCLRFKSDVLEPSRGVPHH